MRSSLVMSPAGAMAWLGAWSVLATLWFVSPLFPMDALAQLQRTSGGWLSVTLLASGGIGLVQLVLLRGPCQQSWQALGWHGRALPAALAATVALWALMQAGTVAVAAMRGDAPQPHAAWALGWGIALGPLLAQCLGTALLEETVFRAWLWPQLSARLGGGTRGAVVGALASQATFALMHVPIRLYQGASAGELAGMLVGLFVVGLVFVLVYAGTRNLFIAVGVHALGNAPTLLFEPQGPAPTLWLLGGALALAAGMALVRRKAGTRLAAGPGEPARGETGGIATNWSGR